jgi:NAD(P)-dependent dehydrogenase (short-subunit alcohol dehydrogenase family)
MRQQFETNLFGPMNVTRAVLPVMRRQRAGHVITISSTAGLVGIEFCAAYAASKFAVEGWMESLRYDVEPYNIRTTVVEPGFFRTELLVEGSAIWPESSIDDYAPRTAPTIEGWKGMNGQQSGDPAKLARAYWPSPIRTSRCSASSPARTLSRPPRPRQENSSLRPRLLAR